MRPRALRSLMSAAAVAAAVGMTAPACVSPPPPTGPPTTTAPSPTARVICDKYGSASLQGGRYIVQNNNWGSDLQQCISVTGAGFSITSGTQNKPTNGPPGSYPSIYLGCHYGNCSANSGLPAPRSTLTALNSTVSISTPPGGEWEAAYDVWFDPTGKTNGQNNGAEIMIWVNHRGRPQPVGSKVATATLAGAVWDVWSGRANDNGGWNVISYVRQQPANSFSGNILAFADDASARGQLQRSWYLTSVQFGFEPWIGGPGLGVGSFSATVG